MRLYTEIDANIKFSISDTIPSICPTMVSEGDIWCYYWKIGRK